MLALREVPRLVYRGAESLTRRTGLRKRPFGKTLIAKLNVMGGSLLRILSFVFSLSDWCERPEDVLVR